MSDLGRVLEAAGYRVSGGAEYQWNCYPNARYLDLESPFGTGSILFSTEDQTVYSVDVSDKPGTFAYRWLNPDWADDFLLEAERRGIDPDKAWDEVKHIDTESFEDICAKMSAVFEGKDFDRRVVIHLELDERTLAAVARYSFEHDCTANEATVAIIEAQLAKDATPRCPATDPDLNAGDCI